MIFKVGDRVRKIKGYVFTGEVLFSGQLPRLGERLLVMQDKGYDALGEPVSGNAVHIFVPEQLELVAKKLVVVTEGTIEATDGDKWWEELVPPPPPPKPEFPITIFVPIKPQPKNGNGGSRNFVTEARLNYLPLKPISSLVTDMVRAEIEFHFTSKIPMGDIDNLLKPTLDLLKGSIIYDDSQVKEISAKYVTESPRMGFKVKLTKYEPTPANA